MTTHTLTLDLKRPPLTSNDQRRAHWTKVRNAKTLVAAMTIAAARRQGIPPLGPRVVTVRWFAPDARPRDAGSLAPFAKAAIDGLVQCGVLPCDDARGVRGEFLAPVEVDRENPRIEITLTEADQPLTPGERPLVAQNPHTAPGIEVSE